MSHELSKAEKKIARRCIDKGLDAEFREGLEKFETILQDWRAGKFAGNRAAYLKLGLVRGPKVVSCMTRHSRYNIVIIIVYLSMIKTLTTVGNSKAVILPSEWVKKYKLDKVVIEDTADGILIRPVVEQNNFQKRVDKLRRNKTALYKRIESQANEPEMIKYYAKKGNDLSDVDPDIVEE